MKKAMKQKILVAPSPGRDITDLLVGIKDFSPSMLILITPTINKKYALKAKKEVEKKGIEVRIVMIEGNMWEAMFEKVARISAVEKDAEIIVHTSAGDRDEQCALTSAAFVNGLKAFSVTDKESMLLPILKFSYYKMLTDKKLEILKLLYQDKTCCKSLDELSKKAKMSRPLTSYHINGTLKSEGLKDLGLVEVTERDGRTEVMLTVLGNLLIKGYVK